AVVSRDWFTEQKEALAVSPFIDKLVLVVSDPLKALQQLATVYRQKFSFPVIGIAGSNGKTTTKEMSAAVLSKAFQTVATAGNFNNHIGVPLTLFRLRDETEIAVVEMGINHHGEMSELCAIAEPTHGLITNIGHEHLEFLSSPKEVAKAEGELFSYLAQTGGSLFINVDDKLLAAEVPDDAMKIRYGIECTECGMNIWARNIEMNGDGRASFILCSMGSEVKVELQITGRHNVYNALAAASIGMNFGVSIGQIKEALEDYKPRTGSKRMERIDQAGLVIINDTYNANPESVRSALSTLSELKCSGKKIAVLGDMLELGKVSQEAHQSIGKLIKEIGVDALLAYGPMMKLACDAAGKKCIGHFESKQELAETLKVMVKPGDALLFKGSRGMRMEEPMENLIATLQQ
ncbi:MAG: UDP-N-acetylmuramoyl-tripeptide--D-alanyl-D-alanine ligase, partial [Chlorobiales bacterium]|nr:UDP-N-acetylmuramoyl-tripeptide--D-alanyl-D-alanine ligase [Chlorobiales bacterium]